MVEKGIDRTVLFRMVEEWVKDPKSLHRPYTVEYLRLVFQRAGFLLAEDGLIRRTLNHLRASMWSWFIPYVAGALTTLLLDKVWLA